MQILHRGIFMPAFDRILQLARMEEMDCEFVEVTAHEGARPTHAVWQGRVYHRGGAVVQDGERYEDFEVATGYGTGPGLCGWCCRHNFYPFYPGVSVRNYTDERLAELDARSGACRTGRLRRGGPHGERHQEPKPGRVSRLVKRAGADTTLKNAVRDGAEWAWVPHGDTCPFCITLASNGWQKASSKVLKGGHAEHIHANCDCEFAIRFDHNTTVAGYDPEKYLKQYRDAGGDINKLRRVNYAANKERINAQKRAAYAERQKYLISAAERGKGPITKITDSVINDFPAVKVDWFTEDQNKQFRSLHKELLQTSRDKNNCFETAFIVSGDLSRKTIVFGDETTISIPPLSTGLNSWILHNHPRNSSFSIEDIAAVTIPGYQGITIAKKNGGLEILTKSPNCDNIRLQNDVRRFLIRKPNKISDSDAQKMISKWVEKGWAKWLIVEKQK